MFLSRIDYDDPKLKKAMENHKKKCMTAEDIVYMSQSFQYGNANVVKLQARKGLKWLQDKLAQQ